MFKTIEARIEGVAPLLMHATNGMDRFNPYYEEKKNINAKRTKKTDADIERLDEIEYLQSFYLDENLEPTIPGFVMEACLVSGAKKSRLGTDFKAGVIIDDSSVKFIYKGSRNPQDLLEDANFVNRTSVVINRARIMRVRPMFRNWVLEFEIQVNTELINVKQVEKALNDAGAYSGLCDFRPKYGRFVVTKYQEI
jgi:hypothetical protein